MLRLAMRRTRDVVSVIYMCLSFELGYRARPFCLLTVRLDMAMTLLHLGQQYRSQTPSNRLLATGGVGGCGSRICSRTSQLLLLRSLLEALMEDEMELEGTERCWRGL